jgi:ribosomal protein S21
MSYHNRTSDSTTVLIIDQRLDVALKTFKDASAIRMREVQQHEHFEKKSVRKRDKSNRARARIGRTHDVPARAKSI